MFLYFVQSFCCCAVNKAQPQLGKRGFLLALGLHQYTFLNLLTWFRTLFPEEQSWLMVCTNFPIPNFAPMALNILSQFVQPGLRDLVGFSFRKALRMQEAQLKKLLYKAKHTVYGREHGFEDMLISTNVYQAFASRIAPGDYSNMYPYWQRAYAGIS